MTRRIFLSYARADRDRVAAVKILLELGGAEVFVDWRSIKPGQRWEDELAAGLEACDVLCVFWSRATPRSTWVEREYTTFLARFRDRPCVPLCADETPLPPALRAYQAPPEILSLTSVVLAMRREHSRLGVSRAESERLVRAHLASERVVVNDLQWRKMSALFAGGFAFAWLLEGPLRALAPKVLAAAALVAATTGLVCLRCSPVTVPDHGDAGAVPSPKDANVDEGGHIDRVDGGVDALPSDALASRRMLVAVLKWVATAQCWIVMPDSDSEISGRASQVNLALCPRSATSDDTELMRGVDQIAVVVEYAGLDDITAQPAPAVIARFDGWPRPVALSTLWAPRLPFRAMWRVPGVPGERLSLSIEAGIGIDIDNASRQYTYMLRSPDPTIEIGGCSSQPCQRSGAVGVISVTVRIPARTPRTATLHQQLDAVQLPDTPLQLTRERDALFEGTTTLAVPAVPNGRWTISAEVDGRTVVAPPIAVVSPRLVAELICGTAEIRPPSCSPIAGRPAGVRVTAPFGIRPPSAQVIVRVAGALVIEHGVVFLTSIDARAGTMSGVLSFVVPDQPGAELSIASSVGDFQASSIVTTIRPSP